MMHGPRASGLSNALPALHDSSLLVLYIALKIPFLFPTEKKLSVQKSRDRKTEKKRKEYSTLVDRHYYRENKEGGFLSLQKKKTRRRRLSFLPVILITRLYASARSHLCN
jgi:ribonuclease D